MPRTVLTKTLIGGAYPSAGVLAVETAADVANLNAFPLTGREIVSARNTDTVSHNVTITSTPDLFGRSQNITLEAIAAGATRYYGGPLGIPGWQQADGQLYLSSDSALVKFIIIQIP